MDEAPSGSTSPLHSCVRLLSERLPGVGGRIVELFERDETFRELCQDYEACAGTAARLEACDSSSSDMRHEYAALRLRLERELLQYLEEHPRGEQA